MSTVKVGIVGTGFVGDIHAASFEMVPGGEVVAVASVTSFMPRTNRLERGGESIGRTSLARWISR